MKQFQKSRKGGGGSGPGQLQWFKNLHILIYWVEFIDFGCVLSAFSTVFTPENKLRPSIPDKTW